MSGIEHFVMETFGDLIWGRDKHTYHEDSEYLVQQRRDPGFLVYTTIFIDTRCSFD